MKIVQGKGDLWVIISANLNGKKQGVKAAAKGIVV